MIVTKQSANILTNFNGIDWLKNLELIGRVCYESHDKITEDSYKLFISNIIKNGHESILEHHSIIIRFITSIAISRELIRHRLCSFTEKSTRYVNEDKDISFIAPVGMLEGDYWKWHDACESAEESYKSMYGTPQFKREVLPISTATNIIVTANLREWRHILKLRTGKAAHPLMRNLMIPLLKELQAKIPIIFDDIVVQEEIYAYPLTISDVTVSTSGITIEFKKEDLEAVKRQRLTHVFKFIDEDKYPGMKCYTNPITDEFITHINSKINSDDGAEELFNHFKGYIEFQFEQTLVDEIIRKDFTIVDEDDKLKKAFIGAYKAGKILKHVHVKWYQANTEGY